MHSEESSQEEGKVLDVLLLIIACILEHLGNVYGNEEVSKYNDLSTAVTATCVPCTYFRQ